MPWTESRSREEWLAEVRRRGERIRRRRRFSVAVIGAFALVLPVSTIAGYLVGPPDRSVELSVAGPAPAGGGSTAPMTPSVDGLVTGGLPAFPEWTSPSAGAPSQMTTTTEVHRPAVSADDRAADPTPPTTIRPVDNPVVGRAGPVGGSTPNGGTAAGGAALASIAPSPDPGVPGPCTASEVSLTLSIEKNTYVAGDRVIGSSVLEKRSAGTCLMPDWWVEIRVLDATGNDVSQGSSWNTSNSTDQADSWARNCGKDPCPRPVEAGALLTITFDWESRVCTPTPGPIVPVPGSPCPARPPGTYTVVAEWTGSGSGPPARRTFQLSPI